MRNKISIFLAAHLSILAGCASAQTSQPRVQAATSNAVAQVADPMRLSRESCVLVTSKLGRGTGFWISSQYLVTCFLVIGKTRINEATIDPNCHFILSFAIPNTTNLLYADLSDSIGVDYDGVALDAESVSDIGRPSVDAAPFLLDFAVLKVKTPPKRNHAILAFASPEQSVQVGDEVTFSGFPLGTPEGVGMVTLKGLVAGGGNGMWCIQSSVNKGNSGGAVLSAKGNVIGVMTAREGGISSQLNDVRNMLGKGGSMFVGGVNHDATLLELVNTLDNYISTGLGYARYISYVRDYCQRHRDLVQ